MTSSGPTKNPHSLKDALIGTAQYVSPGFLFPLDLTQSYYTCTRTRYRKVVGPLGIDLHPVSNPTSSKTKWVRILHLFAEHPVNRHSSRRSSSPIEFAILSHDNVLIWSAYHHLFSAFVPVDHSSPRPVEPDRPILHRNRDRRKLTKKIQILNLTNEHGRVRVVDVHIGLCFVSMCFHQDKTTWLNSSM